MIIQSFPRYAHHLTLYPMTLLLFHPHTPMLYADFPTLGPLFQLLPVPDYFLPFFIQPLQPAHTSRFWNLLSFFPLIIFSLDWLLSILPILLSHLPHQCALLSICRCLLIDCSFRKLKLISLCNISWLSRAWVQQ